MSLRFSRGYMSKSSADPGVFSQCEFEMIQQHPMWHSDIMSYQVISAAGGISTTHAADTCTRTPFLPRGEKLFPYSSVGHLS